MNILQEYIEYISNWIIMILKIQYEYTLRRRPNAIMRIYVYAISLQMINCIPPLLLNPDLRGGHVE